MSTDEEWEAVKHNDKRYDDVFWYAVKSTKIFCRPSCPSRLPKRENIAIYYDKKGPIEAGYRPCKRCRPLNEPVSNQEWVKEIDTILLSHYQSKLTLEELAYLAHGSESYLRHVYKQATGKTPQKRLLEIRLGKAKRDLLCSDLPIATIAKRVGMENTSYFIKKFHEHYGVSPKKFRLKNGA